MISAVRITFRSLCQGCTAELVWKVRNIPLDRKILEDNEYVCLPNTITTNASEDQAAPTLGE